MPSSEMFYSSNNTIIYIYYFLKISNEYEVHFCCNEGFTLAFSATLLC